MPTIIMESGKQSLQNVLEDDLGSELIHAGRFCFSCEQIFANRQCLEEHVCSCASYICSCGTEFADYKDMQEHSSTHEPGHQVLDHKTIKQRRMEKCIEEEQKLKRLQTGEVVWKPQKVKSIPPVPLPVTPALQKPFTSSHMPQVPVQPALISQVPSFPLSSSKASLLPKLVPSGRGLSNIFGDVGAPTVDLCTLYQPVVLVTKMCKLNKKEAYSCGKCGQCFVTRTSLVSHFNSHVIDKVSGCIGCGMLLSSKKLVPRFHICNSSNNVSKFRVITARPLNYRKPNEASSERIQNYGSQRFQATYSLQQKSQNPTIAGKSIQNSVTSTLKLKNEIVRPYTKSSHRPYVTPSLQSNSLNSFASKCGVSVSSRVQSPIPSAYNKSTQGLPAFPSRPLKTPKHSVLSKHMQASSRQNGFKCRVCHFVFETTHMLQRHKCTKAQEFMAQHGRGGRNYKLKSVIPVPSPTPAQVNSERKLGMSVLGHVKKHQIMTVTLDEEDLDDDCYIVESGPDKPAEMIYQVTSSVPIKT